MPWDAWSSTPAASSAARCATIAELLSRRATRIDRVLGDGPHAAQARGRDDPGGRQPDAAARQRRPAGRGPVPGARPHQRAGRSHDGHRPPARASRSSIALGAAFGFEPPRRTGSTRSARSRRWSAAAARVFVALGGNFLSATPDTAAHRARARALRADRRISTKLNRTHLYPGAQALILPCLGRSELDEQTADRSSSPSRIR